MQQVSLIFEGATVKKTKTGKETRSAVALRYFPSIWRKKRLTVKTTNPFNNKPLLTKIWKETLLEEFKPVALENYDIENRQIIFKWTFLHFRPIKIPRQEIKWEIVRCKSHLKVYVANSDLGRKIQNCSFQAGSVVISRYVNADNTFDTSGQSGFQFRCRERIS